MKELFELHEYYDSVKARPKYPYSHRFLKEVYPRYLDPRQEEDLCVLEVGVYNGGAMQALRDYLPFSQIVGVDIQDRVTTKILDWDRLTFVQGDQGDAEFLNTLGKEQGPFDFVLEDGNHCFPDQANSFEILFPYVAPGGVYFVEDVIPSLVYGKDGARWRGKYIFQYFRDLVTEDRFVTKAKSPIESITFHQGLIAVRKCELETS